jgi:hypothetical protein
MPTRLEVLLQSRKSAAADPFHRQATMNDRPATRAALKRLAVWGRRSESRGIITAKLYQDIDDFAWGPVGGQAEFRMRGQAIECSKALNRRDICVAKWKNM